MEIINLFLLSVSYYFVYNIEFYIKMLFLFLMSMMVSLFVNHTYFENKSNESTENRFFYFLIHSFIKFVFFCIKTIELLLNNLIELPGLRHIYLFLGEINKHFLTGRNRIMITLGQIAFQTFVPQFGLMGNLTPPKRDVINNSRREVINNSRREVINNSSDTFKNESDMNNFLDGLLKKDN